jgi:hypothetical protein
MSELRILRDSLKDKHPKDKPITLGDLEAIITGAIEVREARTKCENKKCPTCRGARNGG